MSFFKKTNFETLVNNQQRFQTNQTQIIEKPQFSQNLQGNKIYIEGTYNDSNLKTEENLEKLMNKSESCLQNIFCGFCWGNTSTKKNIVNQNQINLKQQSRIQYLDYSVSTQTKDKISLKTQHSKKSLQKTISKYEQNDIKLNLIRQNIIGINTNYLSPLGFVLQAVYVDHTATNKPYRIIEAMIQYAKLFGANPHTQYSQFGKYSTELVRYSQQSLLKTFNANHNEYIAIPAGNGTTGAINHAIQIIQNNNLFPDKQNLVTFITPYEHHSNILPWVQICKSKVQVLIQDDTQTLIFPQIKKQLINHSATGMIISVSAASNVTSKLTDLNQLNLIIKQVRKSQKNKRIIFAVDCAAFCCHNQLNLKQLDEIDMVFISPHKNLGGAQACGILITKTLFLGKKPSFPGGGTVVFVKGYNKNDAIYKKDAFDREVSGTPPFFGFYRAALSFQLLKEQVGYKFIHQQQTKNTKLFFNIVKEITQKLSQQGLNTYIKIYGEQNLQKRANVVTFNIINQSKQILFYNFVSLVLSDIFGIQIRSGCFCAGPYGIDLLNIPKNKISNIQYQIMQGCFIHKPGYVRFDLAFYLKDFQICYLGKALYYICKYQKNLMKIYTINENGAITLNKMSLHNKKYFYELRNIQKCHQQVKNQKQQMLNKLANRKRILQNQLINAKQICKYPQNYVL